MSTTLSAAVQGLLGDKDALVFEAQRYYDNPPGGSVVARFQFQKTKYVVVEFNKSPGRYYTYYV